MEDGLIQRIVDGSTYPPSIDYVLTRSGAQLIPALDALYIWSMRQMHEKGIAVDEDAFTVHRDDHYAEQLQDVIGKRQLHALMTRDPSSREDKRKKSGA